MTQNTLQTSLIPCSECKDSPVKGKVPGVRGIDGLHYDICPSCNGSGNTAAESSTQILPRLEAVRGTLAFVVQGSRRADENNNPIAMNEFVSNLEPALTQLENIIAELKNRK